MPNALGLFEGFGIELEYMIVDGESLKVSPIADQLIFAERGDYEDVERGKIGWTNELVNHVIELKTQGPEPELHGLVPLMDAEVRHINDRLASFGAKLLPSAMHPFMLPLEETQLWPHGHSEIYAKFDEIFGCKGHGWSNLQSTHINLPFADDAQFGALHAAVRLVLPLLPALAASSPIVEGRITGTQDNRLQFYRDNQVRVPSTTGQVVPEPAYTRKDYELNILARIYQDLSPFDAEGILQHEWANARGAIARFDRGAIEIRVLDVQECPRADLAIAQLVVHVLRAMVDERWVPLAEQKAFATRPLAGIFRQVSRDGQDAVIADEDYLRVLGLTGKGPLKAGDIWQHLRASVWPQGDGGQATTALHAALNVILRQGTLSQRIVQAVGDAQSGRSRSASRERQRAVYRELSACLAEGRQLLP